MLIETRVSNSSYELASYIKILGYDYFLSEDGKFGIKRTTLKSGNKEEIFNFYRKNRPLIYFVKPTTIEALRYSIIYDNVNGIVIDKENSRLFKKSMLNLIRQYNKVVEVCINEISIVYKVINWSDKWIEYPIFSSCASRFNELWSPLSKIALLSSLGAYKEDAIRWIYLSPLVLFGRDP
ncbi:MAG: RNase P p30-like protein [Sulfolobus sp.]